MICKTLLPRLIVIASLVAASTTASAAAIQLWEQSESDLGEYHAGSAAIADNAGTEFYNPAGLVRLQYQEVSAGASFISTDVKIAGTTYVNTMPSLGNQPTEVNGGGNAAIPNLHYAYPIIKDRLVFGFGITSPFSLGTNYGNTTPIKYSNTKTKVQTLNFSPSLGFRINKHISIGAGVDAQRLVAEIDQYLGYATMSPYYDTESINKAYSWGYGFHSGILYEFTPSLRVGLNFRSQIVHQAKGFSTLNGRLADTNPVYALKTPHYYRTGNLSTKLIMPATTMFSIYQDINPTWAWMGSITYAHWGVMDMLTMEHLTGKGGTDTTTTNSRLALRNTWDVSIGLNYAINPRWKLKCGLGFDQSPVYGSNAPALNTTQLSDGDRYVVAAGVHWQPVAPFGIDLGWAHYFSHNVRRQSYSVTSSQQIRTDYMVHNYGNIYGVQLTYQAM